MIFNSSGSTFGSSFINAIIKGLYQQRSDVAGEIPPPPSAILRITDNGDVRMTSDGAVRMIAS